jgi:hypothetical protein
VDGVFFCAQKSQSSTISSQTNVKGAKVQRLEFLWNFLEL